MKGEIRYGYVIGIKRVLLCSDVRVLIFFSIVNECSRGYEKCCRNLDVVCKLIERLCRVCVEMVVFKYIKITMVMLIFERNSVIIRLMR